MPFSLDMSSNNPILTRIEKQNNLDSDDDITDYSGSGEEDYEIDEEIVEYFDCFICKKRTEYNDDCYLIEDTEDGEILSILCFSCKEDNLNCRNCDRDLDCDDNYRDEVKYLLYTFGKIDKCISCMITTKQFIMKPNVDDLEIGKKENKIDYKSLYIAKEQEISVINNQLELFQKDNDKLEKLLKIMDSKDIDEAINTFSQLKKEHSQFLNIIKDNEELTCPEDIPRIINEKNNYKKRNKDIHNLFKENDILEHDKFLDFVKNFKNLETFNNFNKKSIKYDPHHQDDEIFIDLKHDINDYKLKKLLNINKTFKNDKNDTPQNKNTTNININELNSLHINISESYINILDEVDILEKKVEDMEKVLPIFNKLKNNINIINMIEDDDSELSKLFSKLNRDKITEYETMRSIGENIIKNKLNDDYVNNHIKLFNDRKGRIILKCKRIYLLSKHINIESIALSGISHFIRDSHINTFNCLLELFKENPN